VRGTFTQTEGLETLKRAWLFVRSNRYLWPLGFFMALAGGSAQGFSLWVQSPISRGLTGYSPIHRVGERIADSAGSNPYTWIVFIAAGVIVGLGVVAFGAFAQASAVGAVAEIDYGREGDLVTSLRWGRYNFTRYFMLTVGYLIVMAIISLPLYAFEWIFKEGIVLPCMVWLVLAAGFLVASVLASVMLELSVRYVVLEDLGIYESVIRAWVLFRQYWRDAVVTWLYVMVIALAGTITTAILLAFLGTPLVWVFNLAQRHHNIFITAFSILVYLAAWAILAVLLGFFVITASAVWTLMFLELEPST
jgi:hypothetical protein